MRFDEAFSEMMAGNRVKRKVTTGFYYTILPKQDYIWQIFNGHNPPQVFAAAFSISDYTATDWEFVI